MTCPKNYDYLTKSLCAEWAISAIDDEDNGIYLELCEKCGTRFDPFVDEQELCNRTGDDGATIDMFDKYLCLNCSLDEYADKCYVPNDEEYDDDDDDDDWDDRDDDDDDDRRRRPGSRRRRRDDDDD